MLRLFNWAIALFDLVGNPLAWQIFALFVIFMGVAGGALIVSIIVDMIDDIDRPCWY